MAEFEQTSAAKRPQRNGAVERAQSSWRYDFTPATSCRAKSGSCSRASSASPTISITSETPSPRLSHPAQYLQQRSQRRPRPVSYVLSQDTGLQSACGGDSVSVRNSWVVVQPRSASALGTRWLSCKYSYFYRGMTLTL
jgi:hypothetical protein